MPITIIVGGQYGSEGKGKVTHFFAKKDKAAAVIRVGGPNSGHTVMNPNQEAVIFKHLPTASIIKGVKCILTAGHYINLKILKKEIEMSGIDDSDLLIDPYAVIISEEDIKKEESSGLMQTIGSTGCGLGSAILNRISRNEKTIFAKDINWIKKYLIDTNPFLRHILNEGQRVIIEGTQGFGLSLLHSNLYPYCTSRDTTAAGFLSEAGLSPFDVDEVVLVLRTFPIRVGGNSGPLKNETNWDEITKLSGSKELIQEFTSVTKKLRRIAHFDADVVKRAINYNNPTKIVLNHLDYLDKDRVNQDEVSIEMKKFISDIEKLIGRRIDFVGIDRSSLIELKESSLLNNSYLIEKLHHG